MSEPESQQKDEPNLSQPEMLFPPTEPLWTAEEVARYLRLEPETVRSMARDGKLPAIKVGRVWRFKPARIKNWVMEQGG